MPQEKRKHIMRPTQKRDVQHPSQRHQWCLRLTRESHRGVVFLLQSYLLVFFFVLPTSTLAMLVGEETAEARALSPVMEDDDPAPLIVYHLNMNPHPTFVAGGVVVHNLSCEDDLVYTDPRCSGLGKGPM